MRKKKNKKQPEIKKPVFNYFWQETEVVEIMEKNKSFENSIKNAFKCTSSTGDLRTCVFWQRVTEEFDVGSKVSLEGRIQGDVFLVRKIIVYPREAVNV